ncbi:Fructosamine-3-kinase [Allochromatium warmingii]|uniref:Fructosamine-3-kinase n=1 Tax=Allochromatium warmingii TaxID=61595 RepID=A0A1H3E216_ALLWA|nr:fructosamine kinase family protein [Allochromatium warmingii]SDX72716.1 Fructosamine-3-kinase [Allochromatium warmingii]
MTDWTHIAAQLSAATGIPVHIQRQRPIGGGCINRAALIDDGSRTWFVKLNSRDRVTMFEAEAAGLSALAAAHAFRVPEPICVGVTADESFLVLERLDLSGRLDSVRVGQQLAALHRHTADRYGWHRDNTIGSTPQLNTLHPDWASFWRDCRLAPQLIRAAANGYHGRLQRSGERLLSQLAVFLDHRPPASLLHGDLWGGNIGATAAGEAVIFDPAVYHGDREADLAMTELFGGFDASFQAAYREAWPLDPAYRTRKQLYNLYHILNHLNLFGGGYLEQAQSMMDSVLAEAA